MSSKNKINILVAMPQGVVRDSFITAEAAKKLESMGEVIWNNTEEHLDTGAFNEMLSTADVCITGWGVKRIDCEVLKNVRRLKLVAHTGGSVANIVSDQLYDNGVRVISGNKYYAESVAEGVIAYILSSLRDIPGYSNGVQAGRWRTEDSPSEGLLDQTVGLVGFGMTTRALVGMLKPFRVKIKVFSNHISDEALREYDLEKASLHEIFTTCKIISLHSSQRPDTYHMVDRNLLRSIPQGALLINTARGNIIDEEALADELASKRFKAVLDVYKVEPLPADSRLRGLDNVILMPHMAGPTVDRRRFVFNQLIRDIEQFFSSGKLDLEITRQYASYMSR